MNENDKYVGKTLENRYEILELIGEGGMAVVYKALDHRLNRYVAIKIMRDEMAADEEFKRRFCAESQAVAMLSHPNIVSVYDVSHSDENEFIVMELIEGITLKQYMVRRGALSWKETVYFSKQIAKALSHAHTRGIIHRDIKPQNIMLLKDGTIRVADFGIASLENEAYENNGQAIGSIHYIAPEQAKGLGPDARSDIYSLGVVMYEMLTGELPYPGETLTEVALKYMSSKPKPISEIVKNVPEKLEQAVYKAMDTEIENRFQTADELYNAIISCQPAPDPETAEAETDDDEKVRPVRSIGDMSKKEFSLRRRRAGRVTFASGVFAVLAAAVAVFVLIWNFWLEDVFSPVERVVMPSITGYTLESVLYSSDPIYKFNVTYEVDATHTPGTIISQQPAAGRSLMVTPEGISVDVTVCAGVSVIEIPSVTGMNYREAKTLLENTGFHVEIQNVNSDTVDADYVIATSPASGESLNSGSLIFLLVSSGTETQYVDVPNVVGLSEEGAVSKIESNNLTYGGSTRRINENAPGTVIEQSVQAGTSVEEHSTVYVVISSGPQG